MKLRNGNESKQSYQKRVEKELNKRNKKSKQAEKISQEEKDVLREATLKHLRAQGIIK